jgi:HlyD family secretion protein
MDAFRGRSFPGTVSYVSSYVETKQEQNRTLTVEAAFDRRSELPANVLPGLSADIEVILAQRDDVLRIPTYALLEGNKVLKVESGTLKEVKVQTGLHNWEYTEITSGLAAGDRVVVSLDRSDVKDGARVKVAGESEK